MRDEAARGLQLLTASGTLYEHWKPPKPGYHRKPPWLGAGAYATLAPIDGQCQWALSVLGGNRTGISGSGIHSLPLSQPQTFLPRGGQPSSFQKPIGVGGQMEASPTSLLPETALGWKSR